jgi:uncharacterized membrane protein YkoI
MKKKLLAVIGAGVLFAGITATGMTYADENDQVIRNGTIPVRVAETEFPSLARISLDEAIQQALVAVPGQVLGVQLEEENGFLVYDIEVVNADRAVVDVTVDAGSGEVLTIDQDNDQDEVDSEHQDAGDEIGQEHED